MSRVKYKVKQIDWDLIPNFDNRASVEFDDYMKIKSGVFQKDLGVSKLIDLVKNRNEWYEVCEGYINGYSLWNAYQEGNIGERTFKGASISTGDILIDEDNQEWLLTDQDFELVA